jgi:hypothetical protein
MDYEDVYYTYDTGRNALRDHRRVVVQRPGGVPVATTTIAAAPAAPVTALAPMGAAMPQYQYPTAPQPWAGNTWGYPVHGQYVMPGPTNLASILGGFGDWGTLASIVAQIIGALLPLPEAPAALDKDEDNQSSQAMHNSANLIRYQNALAQFARRDQQILTLGSVLDKVLKRPAVSAAFVGA